MALSNCALSQRPVAVITGGTRGIGYAIAHNLAAAGYDLAITGRRDLTSVSATIRSLQIHNTEISYHSHDIADCEAHSNIVQEIINRHIRIDVVVNNAGIAPLVRSSMLDSDPMDFKSVLQTNLTGPNFFTKECVKAMLDTPSESRRCIVFVTSISATQVSVNRGSYCASKAGLSMIAKLWAVELSPLGIPVYEIRPGVIKTDMTTEVLEKYNSLAENRGILEGRIGQPEDVAKAVVALVRGDLPYSTGSVITIDGGLTVPRL